ncbi:MAG: LPS assembly lipoprotein LptE [Candidatus Scalinduaceae bacterium]
MNKDQTKEQITRFTFCKRELIFQAIFSNHRNPPFQKGERGGFRKVLLNHFTGIALLIIVIVISGCGYSTKSLINRNISSIYIPIFENETFRRGIEFDLTKAVKNEIMSKTNLRIVSKDSADTILYGTLQDFKERVLTQNVRDTLVESEVRLFVDIKLVDGRTGRTLVNKKKIRQTTEFIVNRGETLDSATEEGVVNLAKTIVNLLEEKW